MKALSNIKNFAVLVFVLVFVGKAKANEGGPVAHYTFNKTMLVLDTVPPAAQPTPKQEEKPVAETIKEVPKSRKQAVPAPVTVQVKPIQVVKPKIIKPVIKVLH